MEISWGGAGEAGGNSGKTDGSIWIVKVFVSCKEKDNLSSHPYWRWHVGTAKAKGSCSNVISHRATSSRLSKREQHLRSSLLISVSYYQIPTNLCPLLLGPFFLTGVCLPTSPSQCSQRILFDLVNHFLTFSEHCLCAKLPLGLQAG